MLLLGPVLRYVDDTRATVWVETDAPCAVEVLGHCARTFHVAGHHYALVTVRGLRPGSSTPYEVRLDGRLVWPTAPYGHPASTIRTIGHDGTLRLLFGSCHFGETDDPKQRAALGPDALDGYARLMTGTAEREWPDAMLLLGDQIYADQTAPQVRRRMRTRRDLRQPPGTEVADFEEYTYLYRHAWTPPRLRWMLSTLPSMMIFDDHDVRDDWNTSRAWRAQMARTPWWSERLLGALVSYWIYQHIGNVDPDVLERDETYREVLHVGRSGDALPVLRDFALRADTEISGVDGVRWSYRRDLGPARLVVVDSRGGRVLDSGRRSMLSEADFDWVEQGAHSDHAHLLLATSLPWLLPPLVHHVQSWNEAMCTKPGLRARLGEWLRQLGDLEHWAAFRSSFDRLARIVHATAHGRNTRGETTRTTPSTISVLSGDVHHSYLADARYPDAPETPVVQVTCSPVHNAAPRTLHAPLRLAWSTVLARPFRWLAERAGVTPPPLEWSKSAGPYFGNTIGLLELHGHEAVVTLRRLENTAGHWTTPCRRRLR